MLCCYRAAKVSADIAMELGSVSENVQVTAEAQLVESTTSTLGAVVENKRIVDLLSDSARWDRRFRLSFLTILNFPQTL